MYFNSVLINHVTSLFNIELVRKFVFCSKISKSSRGSSGRFHSKGIHRGYECLSNDNKIVDMNVGLELEMKISRREYRLHLFHEFHLDRKAAEATSNICGTMNKDVLSVRAAQHYFHRLKNGNFEPDDLPHPGRPLQVNMALLNQLIEENPTLITQCSAERVGCSHIALETHLHELGKTWKYGA